MQRADYLVIRHAEIEGMGILEKIMDERHLTYEYLNPAENVPDNLDGFGGLVILGGPMGVYEADKYPYLKKEMHLIQSVLAHKQPFLGICLGSQLLAEAAGGRVFPGNKKEIGWTTIQLTQAGAQDPLFESWPQETSVFQWHGDTFDLPPAAVHLAWNDTYQNQAFRIGEKAYGLQFHLELNEKMIKTWLTAYADDLREAGLDPNAIWDETHHFLNHTLEQARIFFTRFLNL